MTSPIPWRSILVLQGGRVVQARTRMRVLRHLREYGKLPDGYTLDPADWRAIDFLGFDDDKENE